MFCNLHDSQIQNAMQSVTWTIDEIFWDTSNPAVTKRNQLGYSNFTVIVQLFSQCFFNVSTLPPYATIKC